MNIVPRDVWGPPGGFLPAATMNLPAERLWVHHGAAGSPTLATLRGYHRYHRSLGWNGLGYSYAITGDGTVYEGRGVRQGAHTEGDNDASFGVVLVGDWTRGTVPDVMVRSLADLTRHLHTAGTLTTPTITGGHRNAPGATTTCPGAAGMDAIDRARTLLASPDQTIEEFMATLSAREQQAAKAFFQSLVNDQGFAPDDKAPAETLGRLTELTTGDDAVTSVQGTVIGGVNAIDAVRDLGYTVSTTERTGPTE